MVETNKGVEILYWYTCKPTRVSTTVVFRGWSTRCCPRHWYAQIAKDDGAYAVINGLNKLFKKDSTITNYQTLKALEIFIKHVYSSLFEWVWQKTLLKPNPIALHNHMIY